MENKKRSNTKKRTRKLRPVSRRKKAYNLVINLADIGAESEQHEKYAQRLKQRLRRAGWDCFIDICNDWEDFEKSIAKVIRKKPFAIVVFGGDGSVRLAASRIVNAKGLLGIVPIGQSNSIFQSLYGHTDPEEALNIVRSGYQTRIDAGLANGTFFLGSLVSGVVSRMIKNQGETALPRMAMGWAKMAGKAADEFTPRTLTIKVDTYTLETQPYIVNLHLLSHLMTLPFSPASSPDDGRLMLVYDHEGTRDIVTNYIKALKKDKYQYSDSIHMLRGFRISISPVVGRLWMMDSEEVEFSGNEVVVEVLHRVLRVFSNAPEKK